MCGYRACHAATVRWRRAVVQRDIAVRRPQHDAAVRSIHGRRDNVTLFRIRLDLGRRIRLNAVHRHRFIRRCFRTRDIGHNHTVFVDHVKPVRSFDQSTDRIDFRFYRIGRGTQAVAIQQTKAFPCLYTKAKGINISARITRSVAVED